ncbi:MAG: ABC transporter permease subunit [Myxococcota bacterium]|nr:ABC transporter permease subunit [Myxococcota bacterium]MEC8424035.1 ABC transporter permease subunit [Myxococcota bacterium]
MRSGALLLRVAAGATVVLSVLPLLGLGMAAIDPPTDPLVGAAPDLATLVRRSRVLELAFRSIGLGLTVGAGALGLGTALAWAEQRLEYPGRRALGVMSLLPLAVPSYVLASTVATALGPAGWLGGPLGLSRPRGLLAASLVLVLVTAPYVQLVVGAALCRSSAAEEEAARTLGASPARVFVEVVLPRLRPSLAYAVLIALLYAVSDFGAVAVLDVPVLTWRLYEAVQHQALDRAALLGGGLVLATVPFFAVARLLRGQEPGRGVANPRRPARRRPGPTGLALTYGAHGLVIGLGVAVPVFTMAGWVLEGLRRGLPFATPWDALGHTAGLALVGSVLTVLIAFAPAALTRVGRTGILMEQAIYLTSALPGVLVAFGLMLVALTASRALGGGGLYAALLSGGGLLLLGYALRFVAEVFGPLRSAVLGLDPRQRETARVLGATWATWARRIAAPALAPGLGAALVVGFVAILKELPVTLLLGGATGLTPLAFRVWDRYNEALHHDAGVAGLLLVGLTLSGVGLTLRWRRHA